MLIVQNILANAAWMVVVPNVSDVFLETYFQIAANLAHILNKL